MKLVEKSKNIFLLLFFTIVGFIVPRFVFAIPDFVKKTAMLIPMFFLALLTKLGIKMVEWAGELVNWVLSPGFINMSYTNAGWGPPNPVIETGLSVTQSLVNMALILILIYIALATILRLQEYQAQKLLPTFIVIALLVNFTPVICGIIVDASNIVMNFFVSQISNGTTIFANNIGGKVGGLGNLWDVTTKGTTKHMYALALQQMILFPFLIILAFVLLLFAVLFLLRYMAIWILVILSPIAFIAYILPVTRKWWKMWWSQFINWCFIGAFAGFFLYLSLFFVTKIQASIPSPSGIEPLFAQNSEPFADAMPYLVGIVFLILGFVMGLKTSAMGAGAVIGFAGAKGKLYGTRAAKLFAREGGGWRTLGRLGKKAGKRLGYERGARWLADKTSRAASRAGDIGIPIPYGKGRKLKPFAALKWASPRLRKAGNLRPRIDAATKTLEGESGVSTAQQILTHTLVGAEATGGLIKNLKQNDAQDIFNEARKIRTYQKKDKKTGKMVGMSDQEILDSPAFNRTIAPLLRNALGAGHLGAVLRRDPRLAKIAARHNVGSYGKLKDADGKQLTGRALERAGVAKAVNEARSHLGDWEPESLKDSNVLEASLANLERDRWLQVNRQIKAGQETALGQMDKTYSDFIRNDSDLAGRTDAEIMKKLKNKKQQNKYWEKYREHIENTYRSAHYFEALKDDRFARTGWRKARYTPLKKTGPGTGSPPPTPGPRGSGTTPTTPSAATGMGTAPPRGSSSGGGTSRGSKP